MDTNWPTLSLSQAIELQRGFDLPASRRKRGHIPVVASTSVVGYHDEKKVDGPGVVIGRSGSIGGARWVESHFWPLNTTLWVKDFRGNDRRYVYYLLQSLDFSAFNVGSGVPTLNRNHLTAIQVALPPLDEQRRIAGVLGALDDLIEINRALVQDLDLLRRLLSKQLLNTSSERAPLSSLARFVNGKNFTKNASGSGRPVIRTPELREGPSNGTVWNDVEASPDHIAKAGDILFIWSGSLMIDRWGFRDALINQHIFKVIPNPDTPDWLVFAQLEHQMPRFLGLAADKATTMGHIQRTNLDEHVPLPDRDAINDASTAIEPLWNAHIELRLEIRELESARDELLPLLISGRVRVGDVAA